MSGTDRAAHSAAQALRALSPVAPEVAISLGSGVHIHLDEVHASLKASAVAGFPVPTAKGHDGWFHLGRIADREVMVIQGRSHLYEGRSIRDVTTSVRVAHDLGARKLIVVNAAGGIRQDLSPGQLMLFAEHHCMHPVRVDGARQPYYDSAWRQRTLRSAERAGVPVTCGAYWFTTGPSYETPAEINAMQMLGADAVGMSTVAEVLQASALGLLVLGCSLITNPAAGRSNVPLSHSEVLRAAANAQSRLQSIVRAAVLESVHSPIFCRS